MKPTQQYTPEPVLPELAGRWVAWSPDGLRIIGHGETIDDARRSAGHATGLRITWVPPVTIDPSRSASLGGRGPFPAAAQSRLIDDAKSLAWEILRGHNEADWLGDRRRLPKLAAVGTLAAGAAVPMLAMLADELQRVREEAGAARSEASGLRRELKVARRGAPVSFDDLLLDMGDEHDFY